MSLTVVNPPKALIALVAMCLITLLMILESIPGEAGSGMLGAIVGYSIGNGVAASSNHKVIPIIGDREDYEQDSR
jgi:hypothetical protein